MRAVGHRLANCGGSGALGRCRRIICGASAAAERPLAQPAAAAAPVSAGQLAGDVVTPRKLPALFRFNSPDAALDVKRLVTFFLDTRLNSAFESPKRRNGMAAALRTLQDVLRRTPVGYPLSGAPDVFPLADRFLVLINLVNLARRNGLDRTFFAAGDAEPFKTLPDEKRELARALLSGASALCASLPFLELSARQVLQLSASFDVLPRDTAYDKLCAQFWRLTEYRIMDPTAALDAGALSGSSQPLNLDQDGIFQLLKHQSERGLVSQALLQLVLRDVVRNPDTFSERHYVQIAQLLRKLRYLDANFMELVCSKILPHRARHMGYKVLVELLELLVELDISNADLAKYAKHAGGTGATSSPTSVYYGQEVADYVANELARWTPRMQPLYVLRGVRALYFFNSVASKSLAMLIKYIPRAVMRLSAVPATLLCDAAIVCHLAESHADAARYLTQAVVRGAEEIDDSRPLLALLRAARSRGKFDVALLHATSGVVDRYGSFADRLAFLRECSFAEYDAFSWAQPFVSRLCSGGAAKLRHELSALPPPALASAAFVATLLTNAPNFSAAWTRAVFDVLVNPAGVSCSPAAQQNLHSFFDSAWRQANQERFDATTTGVHPGDGRDDGGDFQSGTDAASTDGRPGGLQVGIPGFESTSASLRTDPFPGFLLSAERRLEILVKHPYTVPGPILQLLASDDMRVLLESLAQLRPPWIGELWPLMNAWLEQHLMIASADPTAATRFAADVCHIMCCLSALSCPWLETFARVDDVVVAAASSLDESLIPSTFCALALLSAETRRLFAALPSLLERLHSLALVLDRETANDVRVLTEILRCRAGRAHRGDGSPELRQALENMRRAIETSDAWRDHRELAFPEYPTEVVELMEEYIRATNEKSERNVVVGPVRIPLALPRGLKEVQASVAALLPIGGFTGPSARPMEGEIAQTVRRRARGRKYISSPEFVGSRGIALFPSSADKAQASFSPIERARRIFLEDRGFVVGFVSIQDLDR